MDRFPLAPYPSPEARDSKLHASSERLGGEVIHYGSSVEGRPLLAARIPQTGGGEQPDARMLVGANIHGPEYVSAWVALGLLARIESWEPLRRLRERAEIWVIPCLNPDAYARTWERAGQGTLAELRPNARGVDLNRNFPLPAGSTRAPLPGAGSTRPGAATYVGEAPLSEPETAALAGLCRQLSFHAAISGHSFMGRTIPARVEAAREFEAYGALCGAFAAGQPRTRYGRLASRLFDTFTGELEDYLHHHQGTWSVCVETFSWWASLRQHLRAPSLFWRFNPRDPEPWVDNDVAGIAAFLHAALDRDRPGVPTGSVSGGG
jgi:hypothetical protein